MEKGNFTNGMIRPMSKEEEEVVVVEEEEPPGESLL